MKTKLERVQEAKEWLQHTEDALRSADLLDDRLCALWLPVAEDEGGDPYTNAHKVAYNLSPEERYVVAEIVRKGAEHTYAMARKVLDP